MSNQNKSLPDWDLVLSAAARLQREVPGTVLVGGTASAIHAGHRFSRDADHTLGDLRTRFDEILAQLESVAGWKTARVQRPVQILGSLDGIETGVRQLIREAPLETEVLHREDGTITMPTAEEILRIKGVLILKRNATRDYLDFVALADHIGAARILKALASFDALYPQPSGESALQQLHAQLASPMPYDIDAMEAGLKEYKGLDPRWHDWSVVQANCAHISTALFDLVCSEQDTKGDAPPRNALG